MQSINKTKNKSKNKQKNEPIDKLKKKSKASPSKKSANDIAHKNLPTVSIVVCTIRESCMKNIFDNYNRQVYKNKEMIIILNNSKMDISKWKEKALLYKNVKVYQQDESITLGSCMNYGISKAKYDIIAKFDDDDYYGPKYLLDSVKAFQQQKADVIGKRSSYVYFSKSKILAIRFPNKENKYVRHMDGPTLLIKRKVFDKIKFADIPKGIDTQFSKDCIKNGVKIYSINRFHHVYIRNKSSDDHTWKISDESLLKWCKIVKRNVEDYTKYVDI